MSEISVNDEPPQAPGRPPAPACPPVQDILQWIKRFSLFAAKLCTRFLRKPQNCGPTWQQSWERRVTTRENGLGYLRLPIPAASTGKEGPQLVSNGSLAIQRSLHRPGSLNCLVHLCLQDDHSAAYCPNNRHRPCISWFPDPTLWPAFTPPNPPPHARPPTSQEIYRIFNEGCCKQQCCKYRHACNVCQGPHSALDCPSRATNQAVGQSRSPLRAQTRGMPGQPAPRFWSPPTLYS